MVQTGVPTSDAPHAIETSGWRAVTWPWPPSWRPWQGRRWCLATTALLLSLGLQERQVVAAVLPVTAPPPPTTPAVSAPLDHPTLPGRPPQASGDRLGVWLTTVDSPVMRDAEAADQARLFLQQEGFTRAALPLQTAGLITWPALAANNPLGLSLDPALPTASHSASLLQNLRSGGLRTVGWFEFGLMAPAGAPWLNGRDELLLRRRDGSTTWLEGGRIERVWLNPGAAAVQEGLVALVVDACTRLPLDLIQWDDHLGHPADFGYDRLSLEQWRSTPEGAARPDPDPDDPTWRAWRAARVTTLLRRIRTAMASRCPAVRLSISPNPQAFSYRMYLADWLGWVNEGLVDEVVVQLYRDSPAALARELAQPSLRQASRRVPVRIGLLAGLRGRIRTLSSTERDIALVRSQGLPAVDLFFYESARQQRQLPTTSPGNTPAAGATLRP